MSEASKGADPAEAHIDVDLGALLQSDDGADHFRRKQQRHEPDRNADDLCNGHVPSITLET